MDGRLIIQIVGYTTGAIVLVAGILVITRVYRAIVCAGKFSHRGRRGAGVIRSVPACHDLY